MIIIVVVVVIIIVVVVGAVLDEDLCVPEDSTRAVRTKCKKSDISLHTRMC